MPTAKKPATVRRRTKPAATSTKSLSSKPTKASSKQTKDVAPKIVAGKPLPNPYPSSYPSSAKPSVQPLPMPVEPERMPSETFAPLVRTTYNSAWIRRAGILFGAMAIAGIIYAGWTFRGYLPSFTTSIGNDQVSPVTRLSISPTPTPNLDKLNQLSSEFLPQASTSAEELQPINQASSSAQLTQNLQSQSTIELKSELDRYIVDLNRQQVNTNNLTAYQDKAEALEAQGQVEAARQSLVEAVIHAHELSVLHGYYGN